MTRRAVLLFALLTLLAACNYDYAPPGGSDLSPSPTARIPDRAALLVTTPTPGATVTDRQPLIVLYDDHTWDYAETPEPTLTPAPSATPPPTNTPRATATSMPTATSTPSPTSTPDATELPEPTQQTTPPVPTIGPTSIPYDQNCYAGVISAGLNVREDRFVTAARLGVLAQAARIPVLLIHVVKPEGSPAREEWGQVLYNGRLAWIALFYNGGELARLDDNEFCWAIPIEYETNPLPVTPAAWLIHTIPGFNRMELLASYSYLKEAGIPFGAKVYADSQTCETTLLMGGICIFRLPVHGDCPANIGTAEPIQSAWNWMVDYERAIAGSIMWGYRHSGRLWIEIVNECYFGSPTDPAAYAWWGTWLNTAMNYITTHDWGPVVMPTFGPGDGDTVAQYVAWKPALQKLAADGGLIGWHNYTPDAGFGLARCDIWLGCRHRKNLDALKAAGIPNLGYAITEAARGWGCDPVDEADFISWGAQVLRDEGLHSVALWVGGRWGQCLSTNLDGHYISLAQKIAAVF